MSSSWYDEFLKFRAAIVRSVGKTWNDEAFKGAFVEDPISAMKNHCGYDCPFNLVMHARPSDDRFLPTNTGGWVGINNTVRFYLPAPPKDAKQRAEALGAFNQQRIMFLPLK